LPKGEYSGEELLNKVRGLIMAYTRPLSTDGDGDEHHPPPVSPAPRGEEASTASV
jgi:hypothetical protein